VAAANAIARTSSALRGPRDRLFLNEDARINTKLLISQIRARRTAAAGPSAVSDEFRERITAYSNTRTSPQKRPRREHRPGCGLSFCQRHAAVC